MKSKPLFLFFFVALALIPIVKADSGDAISLLDFPTHLGEAMGIDTFSAGILATALLAALFLFPVFILTKNKTAPLMVGTLVLGLGISLGWIPIFLFAITILLIAFGFANTLSKFGG
jgi:hypothetical protein